MVESLKASAADVYTNLRNI